MDVKVAVLGPLEVMVDGRPVDLSAGRLRILVGVLAMSAGRAVPLERVAAALWETDRPKAARKAVNTYLSRLRKSLGPAAVSAGPSGYVLQTHWDRVDALRFVGLLNASAASGDPTTERTLLDEALVLWRGTPFSGVPSDWLVRAEAPRLVERHLGAIERQTDLWLAGDGEQHRCAEMAAQLGELTALHPYRETLWVRLLALLHRCGRSAEALARYGLIRARLADELGADPGPELRDLHAALLSGARGGSFVGR